MTEVDDFANLRASIEGGEVAHIALSLAALEQPDVSLQRYILHLDKLASAVGERHNTLLEAGAEDDVFACLAALKDVIVLEHGYSADAARAEDIENASVMRLIDRGCGGAMALGVLYFHCARAQGWNISVLGFPEICVLALQGGGNKALFDPFNDAKLLQAPDLRAMLKEACGDAAEISADYFEEMSDANFLVRLQNKVKFKQIEIEDYAAALRSVRAMQLVDPKEYRLLLDAGVLYARLKQRECAVETLESYIECAPEGRDRQEAVLLLYDLQDT